MLAKTGLTVGDHQERTVENFVRLLALWDGMQAQYLRAIDRHSCPFMPGAAIWAVFTYPGPTDLIASDRGYGFVWHKDYGRGFAIPINTRQALVLLPNRRRIVLRAVKNKWRAPIDEWASSEEAGRELNRSLASHALNTIVGPTAASVENYSAEFAGEADHETEPFNADWPSSRVRRLHEWDWLRAVHIIGGRPSANEAVPNQLYEMDTGRFAKGWMPRLLLAMYDPDGMNRELSRHGDDVGLALMEVDELPPFTTKTKAQRANRRQ